MSVKQISPGVYQISPSYYNVYLIDSDELILVDVGDPNSANAIQKAVQSIGKQMTDICHILLTHCHRDHAGGLAKIKQMTGAPVYMHPIEATAVRKGETRREFFKPAPGLISKIIVPILTGPLAHGNGIEPADVENEVQDGDVLPIAGGIRAIHVPGHSGGQLAFLWERNGGVLFAAEAAVNNFGIVPSIVVEDYEEAIRSLEKLAAYEFDTACFCHGNAILHEASSKFKQKWGIM